MSLSEQLSNNDFEFIQQLVYQKTGIVVGDHKREMIYRRLSRRMRDLQIDTVSDYCEALRSESDSEMVNFINAVTTNLTSFFRENHHFDFLEKEFFPAFIVSGERKLRIWSSACSTGEEPYSLAITMLKALGNQIKSLDAKILATDLDTQVIATAKKGEYRSDRVKDISSQVVSAWFDSVGSGLDYRVKEKLKQYITFNKLNLLGHWPMKGKFDVIFCRNVLIYFDKPTQEKLVNRFYEVLKPGGFLMLGHSESILKGSKNFNHLGKTIYQKQVV